MAAAPRGTAASARFGASSVGSLPPPFTTTSLLSVARGYLCPFSRSQPSVAPTLSVWPSVYTCQSPCVSIPPLSATLHPVSSFYLDHRRRPSVSRSPPPLVLPLAPSSSLALVLVTYTFCPLRCTTPFSLHPAARSLFRALALAFNPSAAHIRASGWRGTPCGTTLLPLPLGLHPLLPLTLPPARLFALRHPSSSRGYSASQHRRRRENRYYGEINMIGRRMPRYPYT